VAPGIEINRRRRATIIFLIALSAVTLWFCYLIAKPFLNPLFFAVVLAIVFYPLHTKLHKSIGNSNAAAILSTLCVLLAIAVPAFLLGAALQKELTDIYQSLNAKNAVNGGGLINNLLQYLDKARTWLGQYVDLSEVDLRAELVNRIQQLSSYLLSQFAGLAGGITSFVLAAVITFFSLFYLFRDGRRLWRRMAALIPLSANQIEKLTDGVSRTITASMYGGMAVAIVQGLLTGMAFWVLGLPSPVLWGMTAAIFSFVPLIGTSIVWLPASIILLMSGHIVKGLILLGWGAVIVGLSDNIIRPLVISGQTRFHPLYVFFALLGGIQAFGIIGLFVGPVVLAVAQELFGLIREEMRPQEVEEGAALTDH
jgi:predicted PurR-regulated permease PerM